MKKLASLLTINELVPTYANNQWDFAMGVDLHCRDDHSKGTKPPSLRKFYDF